MERHRLLHAIEIMGARLPGDDGIDQLMAAGFSRTEAARLVEFVPEAFAVPIMEELGLAKIVDTVSAINRNGEWEEFPLQNVPIFQSALKLVRECPADGMDPNSYQAIVERSVLLSLATQALNAGTDISGAVAAIALVYTTADELRGSCLQGGICGL